MIYAAGPDKWRLCSVPPSILAAMAAELMRARVSLIVAFGNNLPARAAKAATSTIPIVFAMGADPVALGLVDSFNRPGCLTAGLPRVARPRS
jgi:putative ABC transport system substrate-binding protein